MNRLQVEDIRKLTVTLKGSDEADIKVRKDAHDIWFEADWLGELLEAFVKDVDEQIARDVEHQQTVDNLAALILAISRQHAAEGRYDAKGGKG